MMMGVVLEGKNQQFKAHFRGEPETLNNSLGQQCSDVHFSQYKLNTKLLCFQKFIL